MFILDFLKQFEGKKVKLFVDMDGVVADYDFGQPGNYHLKRPLYTSIQKLEAVSKLENVEMYILSASKKNEGIGEKNSWLDIYAPFFSKENRIILSREENNDIPSSTMKSNYLKELERDDAVLIVIDDDPKNLKEIHQTNEDIILLKDTALID